MGLHYDFLIVGGSGFFGKSLLSYFNRNFKSKKILILSRSNSKIDIKNYPNINIGKIDTDIKNLKKIPSVKNIIYAATPSSKSEYEKYGKSIIENVNAGLLHFSNLIKADKFDGNILYTSSGAIYGPQNSNLPIKENAKINSYEGFSNDKRIYAESKLYCEEIIKDLGILGFRTSIARCFAFVGEELPLTSHFVIGNIIDCLINKKIFMLKANSRVYRSFMHTDDLCNWLIKIIHSSSTQCPIFNVGSDEAFELRDLLMKINNEFGLNYKIKNNSAIGEDDWYIPSVDKIKKELDCNITLNLTESIKKIIY